MKFGDYRVRLADDFARLRDVATDLTLTVPTCPEWTVEDLVRHVAVVYLHKVASMQLGRHPENWPPDFSDEPALELLQRAYTELSAELDERDPTELTHTWYPAQQTVAFWHRRMALETAVHRFDAEMAAGKPTPIAADLALDGIDEFVVIMLGWGETTYGQGELVDSPTVEIRSGGRSWYVTQTAQEVQIADSGQASVLVRGEPSDVLLWLWRRAELKDGLTGDTASLEELMRKAGS